MALDIERISQSIKYGPRQFFNRILCADTGYQLVDNDCEFVARQTPNDAFLR